MSDRNPALDALRPMEAAIEDLQGWSGLVVDLGASANQIDPNGLSLVGGAMLQAVKIIQVAFDAAWSAAGGNHIAEVRK